MIPGIRRDFPAGTLMKQGGCLAYCQATALLFFLFAYDRIEQEEMRNQHKYHKSQAYNLRGKQIIYGFIF